jgi:hypothetical protein
MLLLVPVLVSFSTSTSIISDYYYNYTLVVVLCFLELLAAARQRSYRVTCRRAQDHATEHATNAQQSALQTHDRPHVTENMDLTN